MLAIRLSRIGKKNKPMYRLIISEKAKDPYGRALEIFGSYNPHTKDLNVKADRIKYWLSKGAQMSVTVNNLLIEKELIEGKKIKAAKQGKKKKDEKKSEEKGEKSEEKQISEKKEEMKEEPTTPKPEEKPEEKSEEKVKEIPGKILENKETEQKSAELKTEELKKESGGENKENIEKKNQE
ncbi:MAG: 30S ribosomal protein S16 [Patescibacteria group bacterium]